MLIKWQKKKTSTERTTTNYKRTTMSNGRTTRRSTMSNYKNPKESRRGWLIAIVRREKRGKEKNKQNWRKAE